MSAPPCPLASAVSRISVSLVRPSGLSQVAVGNLLNQAPTLVTPPRPHPHPKPERKCLGGRRSGSERKGTLEGFSMHLLGCLVGSEAESWEGRRGVLLLSGFWEGSHWAVTLYRADQDTSGFCVPKLLLPCVTPPFFFFFFAAHFPASETACFFSFWPHWESCGILVPRPGIEPVALAVEAQSPNQWTCREVSLRLCVGASS